MNEDCRGHEFERHGKRWGRCMRDSTIFGVALDAPFPTHCPNCFRKWVASTGLPPSCEFDAEIQIDFPFYKARVTELEKREEQLGGIIWDRLCDCGAARTPLPYHAEDCEARKILMAQKN